MLFTAIDPILCNEWTTAGWVLGVVVVVVVFVILPVVNAVSLVVVVVDDADGGGVRVNGNLTQLPLPVTPVVSSESSPVWRCNQAFFRWRGAAGPGADKNKNMLLDYLNLNEKKNYNNNNLD